MLPWLDLDRDHYEHEWQSLPARSGAIIGGEKRRWTLGVASGHLSHPTKINRRRRWRLPRCDGDFDSGIRAEIIAVKGMMFSEPVPNTPPNFAEKIDAALFPQVSEIADQVCEGVFVNGAAALLKNRERLGGRGDVFGFIDHASPPYIIAYATGAGFAFHEFLSVKTRESRSRSILIG